MKEKRAVNDSSLTKIGDLYHYIIALRDCFELNETEVLQIEVNGDISVIGKSNGFQKEIKHHLKKKYLLDRDIDFWKTLANWYEEYNRTSIFSSLILFTTAQVKPTSIFYNWNGSSKEEKLSKIRSIGVITKEKEADFRKQYNRIFNSEHNEEKLLNILERFTIEASNENIENISNTFSKYITNIPKQNRDHYIEALLGRIMGFLIAPPYKCEISKQQFEKITQELSTSFFNPSIFPLPDKYSKAEVPQEQISILQQKRFVAAIKDIDYECEIHHAISDYWKTCMTIEKCFRDDPIYIKSLDEYKDELKDRLFYTKSTAIIEAEGYSTKDKIKKSKILYNNVMQWEAKNFGSIINNKMFFQHGVIHDIVDSGSFIWKIEEEDNEHR